MNPYSSFLSLENIMLMVHGSILNTPSGSTVQIHKLEIDFFFLLTYVVHDISLGR